MELLNSALSYDIFDSEYLYWVDSLIVMDVLYQDGGIRERIMKHIYNPWRKFSKDIQYPFNLRTQHN